MLRPLYIGFNWKVKNAHSFQEFKTHSNFKWFLIRARKNEIYHLYQSLNFCIGLNFLNTSICQQSQKGNFWSVWNEDSSTKQKKILKRRNAKLKKITLKGKINAPRLLRIVKIRQKREHLFENRKREVKASNFSDFFKNLWNVQINKQWKKVLKTFEIKLKW